MTKRRPGKQTRTGGRTTPKRSSVKGRAPATGAGAGTGTGRYTPPVPRVQKVSPRWVPALMFVLLIAGAVVIVLNYFTVLPGGADNRYLLVGLALITGGFITATRYH
ncbi:MAG: cell division protein CrgA [Actinobacteria bacterium]|nr:cell division protein CrgA [Actinomycetota bacterium]